MIQVALRYTYIYIYIHIYIYIYTHMYRQRERDRERYTYIYMYTSAYVNMCICIVPYVWTCAITCNTRISYFLVGIGTMTPLEGDIGSTATMTLVRKQVYELL